MRDRSGVHQAGRAHPTSDLSGAGQDVVDVDIGDIDTNQRGECSQERLRLRVGDESVIVIVESVVVVDCVSVDAALVVEVVVGVA